MDENNSLFPNGTTSTSTDAPTSTDYIIGGTSTPVSNPAPAVETTSTPEPTPAPAANTAKVYEQANDAATNPASNSTTDTPIFTTSTTAGSSTMDSYSVPTSTTYTNTGASYSNDTYSSTYVSTGETTESKGLATASLICGIASILLSCCCGCGCINLLLCIPGIICGVLQKPMSDGRKPGTAKAGIITSAVGIVLGIIMSVVSYYLIQSGTLDSLNY